MTNLWHVPLKSFNIVNKTQASCHKLIGEPLSSVHADASARKNSDHIFLAKNQVVCFVKKYTATVEKGLILHSTCHIFFIYFSSLNIFLPGTSNLVRAS